MGEDIILVINELEKLEKDQPRRPLCLLTCMQAPIHGHWVWLGNELQETGLSVFSIHSDFLPSFQLLSQCQFVSVYNIASLSWAELSPVPQLPGETAWQLMAPKRWLHTGTCYLSKHPYVACLCDLYTVHVMTCDWFAETSLFDIVCWRQRMEGALASQWFSPGLIGATSQLQK